MKKLPTAYKLILLLACFLTSCTGLEPPRVFLVELAKGELSEASEAYGRSDDRLVAERFDQVVRRLLKAAHEPDEDWQLHVLLRWPLDVRCLPGQMFVASDRFLQTSEDLKLAFIVSHELAHCLNDDYERRVRFQASANLVSVLIAVISRQEPSVAQSRLMVFDVMNPLGGSLPFSRRQEKAADRAALLLLARACYPPRALLELLRKQWPETKKSKHVIWSSHPTYRQRLKALESVVDKAEADYSARCGSAE